MIDIHIKDGGGSRRSALVLDDQSLYVTPNNNVPAPGVESQKIIIFRQYFTDDGTKTGSNDMRVNGSTTNVDFWIPASVDRDRYITSISFEIADQSATLDKFGAITALTNGCQLLYDRPGVETIEIDDAIKSNWDLIRLCQGNPPIGSAADAFRANNVVGNAEGYIPFFDLKIILPPYGIKLDAGTTDKIIIRIRDNITGIDAFDAIAFGFERLP